MKRTKRILDIKVLPGQPTDGSGVVCIHLVVPDSSGPFTEPQFAQIDKVKQAHGQTVLTTGPMTCRLACDKTKKRQVAPKTANGVTAVTMRTGDPRAATCPACLASKECLSILRVLSEAASGVPQDAAVTTGNASSIAQAGQ